MMENITFNYTEEDKKILRTAWGKYELHKNKIDDFIDKSEHVAEMLFRLKHDPLPAHSLMVKGAKEIKDKSMELINLFEKYKDSVVGELEAWGHVGEEKYDIGACIPGNDGGYYERAPIIKHLLEDTVGRCCAVLEVTKPHTGRDIKVPSTCVYLLATEYQSIFNKQPKFSKTTNFYVFTKLLSQIVGSLIGDEAIKSGVSEYNRDQHKKTTTIT